MGVAKLFIRRAGRVEGPFDVDELRRLHARGRLRAFDEVSDDRLFWRPASGLIDTFAAPVVEPPQEALPVPAEEQWYYTDAKGKEVGPVPRSQLLALAQQGVLPSRSEVWREGMREWVSLTASGLLVEGATVRPGGGRIIDDAVVHTGDGQTGFQCPLCKTRELPLRQSSISTGGWIMFVVLMFACFPIFWVAFFIRDNYIVCRVCGAKVG